MSDDITSVPDMGELDSPQNDLPPALAAAADAGRLVVASAAAVYGEEGVPLPRDGGTLLVLPEAVRPPKLAPPRTVRPGTVKPGTVKPGTLFESGEHTYLGDHVVLAFENGEPQRAEHLPLSLPNGLKLTYGQIVALAGDFYGIAFESIGQSSQPEKTFEAAFATLARSGGAVSEVPRVLHAMQIEIDAVNKAIIDGRLPSTAYTVIADRMNGMYNRATGGGSRVSDLFPLGRYLFLALSNVDHFGAYAVSTYKAGHAVALHAATTAHGTSDPATRHDLLVLAYALNAFADHYLTDLFSSGHLRVPRAPLLYGAVQPFGSLLAKFMHDEDSHYGLDVRNRLGERWQAYGDKKLLDPDDAANLTRVQAAIQQSVDEVWAAFRSGKSPASTSYRPLDLVPDLADLADPTDRRNPSPLFTVRNGTVVRRTDPRNRRDYSWTRYWSTLHEYDRLKKLPEFQKLGDGSVRFGNQFGLIQMWSNDGRLGLTELATRHDGTFDVVWGNWNTGRGTGGTYLGVDADGDDRTHVVQLWDSGRLGLAVWSPVRGGPGYDLAFLSTDMGEGAAALAFVVAGRVAPAGPAIVQLWNNAGSLALVTYRRAAPGYTRGWSTPATGVGAPAITFLTADVDGDGDTEIVRVYDAGGRLGLSVLDPRADGSWAVLCDTVIPDAGPGAIGFYPMCLRAGDPDVVVHVWDNGGRLGFVTYALQSGAMKVVSAQPSTGYPSDHMRFVPMRVDGDGTTQLLQLRDLSYALGMVLFAGDAAGAVKQRWASNDLDAGSRAVDWVLADGPDDAQTLLQLWDNGRSALGVTAWGAQLPPGRGLRAIGNMPRTDAGPIAVKYLAVEFATKEERT